MTVYATATAFGERPLSLAPDALLASSRSQACRERPRLLRDAEELARE